MKKLLIYIASVIFSAGFVTSCDLNILPSGSTTGEQMRKSPTGVQDLINGAYYQFIVSAGQNAYYVRQYYQFADFSSDDIVYGHETEDELNMIFRYDERHAGLGNVNAFWTQSYKVVYACNTALDIAGQIEDKSAETYYLMGEAAFLKAYVYHCLLRLFAMPYDPATASSDAGIIFRENNTDSGDKARLSVADSYAEVLRLLAEAEDYFGKGESNRSADRGFASLRAVYGLYSRVCLYMQDWDKCIEYSDLCLGGRNTIGADDYKYYFANTPDSPETIWCVRFTPDQDKNQGSVAGMIYSYEEGTDWGLGWTDSKTCWGEEGYSSSLFDAMGGYDSAEYDADVRSVFVQPSRRKNGLNLYGTMKCSGQNGSNTLWSPPFIRRAEIILNKAEAYAHKGDVTNALKFVNAIRERRFTDGKDHGKSATSANVLDVVLNERRVELSFEGFRFYDLRRNHRDIVRNYWGFHTNTYNAGGVDKDAPGLGADGVTTKWNDNKLTLPVPTQEINNNRLAKQNPGY